MSIFSRRPKPPAPTPPTPSPAPPAPTPAATPAPLRPSGVRVILHHRPDPPPRVAPEIPQPRGPRVLIFPPNQRAEEREAFLAEIEARHGDLIRREIARRRDIAPGSRDDVRQMVLLVLCAKFEQEGPPDNPAAYVRTVVDNAACNHAAKKARRPRLVGDAEVDDAAAGTPDPEQAAIRAELLDKLERYRAHLTEQESVVLLGRAVQGLAFTAIAEQLGLPSTTVFRLHAAAIEKLRDQAAASERAAAQRVGGGAPPEESTGRETIFWNGSPKRDPT